jgi:protein-L-isoaspartate(D-aspartate) O-methyltransferase
MSTAFDFARARFNMVEQQVRTWDVLDHRVLDVLHEIPREAFVPNERRGMAYADVELPIGFGQQMFKPVFDGRVLQALKPQPGDDVLEIGTGSGYLTACLAALAGCVHSIERVPELALLAKGRLDQYAARKVSVEVADVAMTTFTPARQFDVIVLGAAVPSLPDWRAFLRPGGRLFAVRGRSPAMEAVLLRPDGAVESLFETDLPYLHGATPKQVFSL